MPQDGRGGTQIVWEFQAPSSELQRLQQAEADISPSFKQQQVSHGSRFPAAENVAVAVHHELLQQLFSAVHGAQQGGGSRNAGGSSVSTAQPGTAAVAAMSATLQLQGQVLALNSPSKVAATVPAMQIPPAVLAVSPAAVAPPALWTRPAKQQEAVPPDSSCMQLTLHLSASLQEGTVVLARHATEGYLSVSTAGATMPARNDHGGPPSNGAVCMLEVSVEVPKRPGKVMLEVLHQASGLIGFAAPVVVVPCAEAAEELCQVQQSTAGLKRTCGGATPRQQLQSSGSGHPFLLDVGSWIDSASGVLAAARPASREVAALDVASGMINFCVMTCLPACAAVIMDLLVEVYGIPPGPLLANKLSCGLPKLSLLHQAVGKGDVRMVDALIKWARRHGVPLDWNLPGPEGLTPLHLAALLPNAADMMKLLLDGSPSGNHHASSDTRAGALRPMLSAQPHGNGSGKGPASAAVSLVVGARSMEAGPRSSGCTRAQRGVQSRRHVEEWLMLAEGQEEEAAASTKQEGQQVAVPLGAPAAQLHSPVPQVTTGNPQQGVAFPGKSKETVHLHGGSTQLRQPEGSSVSGSFPEPARPYVSSSEERIQLIALPIGVILMSIEAVQNPGVYFLPMLALLSVWYVALRDSRRHHAGDPGPGSWGKLAWLQLPPWLDQQLTMTNTTIASGIMRRGVILAVALGLFKVPDGFVKYCETWIDIVCEAFYMLIEGPGVPSLPAIKLVDIPIVYKALSAFGIWQPLLHSVVSSVCVVAAWWWIHSSDPQQRATGQAWGPAVAAAKKKKL